MTEPADARDPDAPWRFDNPPQEQDMTDETSITSAEPMPVAQHAPMSEIGGLIQQAIATGLDVSALERLEAMYERAQQRDAVAAYNTALAAFHAACPVIDKNKTAKIVSKKSGANFSYGFASLDHMVSVIRPILAANDLSFSWDMLSRENGCDLCVCTIRHVGGHSESSRFPVVVENDGRMSAAQSAGSALTFARRYSLTAALGLTTGEPDNDGAGGGDAPGMAAPLSDQQMTAVLKLIAKIGEAFDRDAFLRWLKVDTLDDIPAAQYARVTAMLQRKIDDMAKGVS